MGILLLILFGGLVGWIASMVMGTDAQQGIVLNVIVGIVGSVIGGALVGYFGGAGVSGFNLYSFLVSVLGAVVLIAVVKLLRRV